ncbi:MAG TPA: BamA/TamA family outer membrane protein [Thermoanaerobaculia bacterium]|nr:BamA/TamA family outer membrane protein [Thermoanaerobaculia bacterium]
MNRPSRLSSLLSLAGPVAKGAARVACLFALAVLLATPPPLGAQQSFGPSISGYGFGQNKIAYRTFDWHIYHSPHFNVYYYSAEESSLQKIVSFAESDYDDVSRFLNYQIKDPIPLIYFATHSAFEQNNIILDFIPEGIGAFASPVRFRMVMPIDDPDGTMIAIMRHELTHIFQYHMLFQGSLAKALANGPPTWFLEGMASYVGRDENVRDTMFLRDAVVNDIIPPITRVNIEGFFAYRFGHAVFSFIEDRWGHEGFLDFLFEMRNTLGGRVDRAVKRAFKLDPEDFDIEFRRWLRKKYLPQLIVTGEPGDFGRVFRVKPDRSTYETSPVASPSGDLVAAFSAYHGKVDVVLFDARKRTFIRNLTKPFSSKYQYLVAQELQLGRRLGRDLAFSPDGNTIAVFAKRERGRSLMLLDAVNGGIRRIIDMDEIEQQQAPSFSPDGKRVAFSGNKDGRFDIFILDLATDTITRLTDDDIFDGAPSFSPDGKSIVLVSVVGAGAHGKVFRMDLDKPGVRIPITTGDSNENDPIYSPDGKRIYFTSDRGGRENIYSRDLTTGEERQYTNVVSGAFMPAPLKARDGEERLVYTGYWKMSFDIYETGTNEPVAKTPAPAAAAAAGGTPAAQPPAQTAAAPSAGAAPATGEAAAQASPAPPAAAPAAGEAAAQPQAPVAGPGGNDAIAKPQAAAAAAAAPSGAETDLAKFEPDIQVTIDPANREQYHGYKFFLEDAQAYAGVDTNQTYTGRILLTFSDNLGDKRIIADLSAIETYSNFNLIYADLSHRMQWYVRLFDERAFYIGQDIVTGRLVRGQQSFQESGAIGTIVYPFSFYHRIEIGAGYMIRKINFTDVEQNLQGQNVVAIAPSSDNFPVVTVGLVGDSSQNAYYGPVAGQRYRADVLWGPSVSGGGTIYENATLDARKYFPLTLRSNFAFRMWGGIAGGQRPTPFFLGGLDTIRGVDFRSLIGDRAFFGNAEFRFPLIDLLATPVLGFGGIRGVIFFDTGAAWFNNVPFQFYSGKNHQLIDGIAAYGAGFNFDLLGLEANVDFAKVTTFKTTTGLKTDFWIGTRF